MAKKRKIYDVWMEYDNFLRSLHLESVEKQSEYSRKKRFHNYLKRLPIIILASLLTTLTFQFFINPNKLFNSGLSGIIQVLTNYFFTKQGVSEQNRIVGYYAVVVLVNILIVSIVQFFYPYNFEVNSTAIFYVLSQFMWSSIFRRYSLQNYFFNRFSSQSWSKLSSLNQLGLTLPFYITISIVSAIIHTYGYSLLYQAKSTPGGFEIITSTLAQDKKRKVSIGSLNKIFGIFVVFFITIFNFFFINNSAELKEKGLIDLINENNHVLEEANKSKIKNRLELDHFLEKFSRDKFSYIETFNLKKLLTKWSGDDRFNELPNGIATYLESDKKILQILSELEVDQQTKVNKILRNGKSTPEKAEEANSFLSHIKAKIEEKKRDTYERNFLGYFKYITNDEKLWASLIYIFFSSYLINQIFPKSKFVLLTAFLKSGENLDKMLITLRNYNPSYFQIFSHGEKNEEEYLLLCPITKWDYQLLASEINKFGKVLVNTLDESN